MEQLTSSLHIALANTFVMYFKAHSYHWNVEGVNFPQLHDFFGDLYEELHGAVDTIAEEIRALDAYAPISLIELYNSATLKEDEHKPTDYREMVLNLATANNQVIQDLNNLFKEATAANNQGLADFAAGRLDVHNKHGWMLKTILRG